MTMEMALSEDIYMCDDGKGNGCGRMFDCFVVARIRGLCAGCAEDLPDEVGC